MGFIGVIDSGVGGLTVLQKLVLTYPYNFVYVADHAFCPYGTKTNDVVYSRASKLVGFLKDKGAQAVALACNTMSAFAKQLQHEHGLPIYDVITPTCKRILDYNVKRLALLATRSTIANGAYQANLSKFGIQVTAFDCSAFVPYVEQGATTSLSCQRAIDSALHSLRAAQVDAVILGCTHFPLMRAQIADYCADARIVECSIDLPDNVASAISPSKSIEYFTTGDVDFACAASKWYGNAYFKHAKI